MTPEWLAQLCAAKALRDIETLVLEAKECGILSPEHWPEVATILKSKGITDAQCENAAKLLSLPGNVIYVVDSEIHRMVDEAEDLLIHEGKVFQRGTALVRLIRLEKAYKGRPAGQLQATIECSDHLVERLTRIGRFLIPLPKKSKPVDCPGNVARKLLARVGEWRVPSLKAILTAPTLRADGTLLQVEGLDEESGIFLDFNGVSFPPIPEIPTLEDAKAALEVLREVIKGFPFEPKEDWSGSVAFGLTILVRPAFPSAPIFNFNAPKAGSGKSLQVAAWSLMATGRPPTVTSQIEESVEEQKQYFALLREGVQVISIDNLEKPLGGDALCTILTEPVWSKRILGVSATQSVPTTGTTWACTGNGVVLLGDLTSRAILINVDPGIENPEERDFEVNLRTWVLENRPRLVVAGLTLLRAYVAAGRPPVMAGDRKLKTFGRFEDWSALVRSALMWAGAPDPCASRVRLRRDDPVRGDLQPLLDAWWGSIKDRTMTIKELVAEPFEDLREALYGVAPGENGLINKKKLGRYLLKFKHRVESGLRIVQPGDRAGVALWRVEEVVPAVRPAAQPDAF